MAGRRAIARIGPPTRGLTDFPEHATPEHSTQALNVEFCNGGVSTRLGTQRIKDSFYTQGGTARSSVTKLVRQFSLGPGQSQMTVVGLIPTAGGDANAEILIVDQQEQFMLADPPPAPGQVVTLNAADVRSKASPDSRWDACVFMETLVVCTDIADEIGANVPQVHYKKPGQGFVPLDGSFPNLTGPINRTVVPFHHGGDNPSSPASDDPGDYTVAAELPMRARFCRVARNRLFLGNIGMSKLPFDDPAAGRAAVWYSNLEDVRGWPVENLHLPPAGDQGEVTGLATNGDHIVVFRRASISMFRVDGPGHNEFVYRQVVSNVGCVGHSTIIDDVQGMTCFLAQDGFYGFTGSGVVELSAPIRRTLRECIAARGGKGLSGAHAVHYPKKGQVWLCLGKKGSGPDTVFVMDYMNGYQGKPAWSEFEFQTGEWANGAQKKRLGGFCTNATGTSMYGVTVGTDNISDMEKFDVGDSTDQQGSGSLIGFVSRWESGPIGYGRNSISRWRYFRPMIRPTMDSNVRAWWRQDEQAFDGVQFNNQFVAFAPDDDSGGAVLGAFVLGTSRVGGAEDHSKRIDIHSNGICRYGRVGITTTAGAVATHKFDVRGAEIDTLQRQRSRR